MAEITTCETCGNGVPCTCEVPRIPFLPQQTVRQARFAHQGFEAGEPTEADVQHSCDKAREAALFLVEKYARQVLSDRRGELSEFVMAMGCAVFIDALGSAISIEDATGEMCSPLGSLLADWDDALKLTGEPMRFTADGPVRREW